MSQHEPDAEQEEEDQPDTIGPVRCPECGTPLNCPNCSPR